MVVNNYISYYNRYFQKCQHGVAVKPPPADSRLIGCITFNIHSVETHQLTELYVLPKSTEISEVRRLWAMQRGVTTNVVKLLLDHVDITGYSTLETAGVYDGAVLYSVLGRGSKIWE